MHGLGNDYIYFNCLTQTVEDPPSTARRLADRHFGIGGDGIVLIKPSESADYGMEMYNADGSRAEMCGNAIRCVGKYLYEKGITDRKELSIETGAGILRLWLRVTGNEVGSVRVDMGEPVLEGRKIPTVFDQPRVVNEPLEIDGKTVRVTCLSMGNPHCVVIVEKNTDDWVLGLGPKIEVHPAFPNRINAEFISVDNRRELGMRVWERGTGETLACGTGACAAGVAAHLNGVAERETTVHLPGGDLQIDWAEDNHVYLTGPATFVFEGEVEI